MAQMEIELILLRQWASYMAMPIWLMGPDGTLLYFNGPAEPILGKSYELIGKMPGEELAAAFETKTFDGLPIDAKDLPINIAREQQRPAFKRFKIKGLDGPWRAIEVAAFPIIAVGGRNLGAVAIFKMVDSL